jgi:hypothetical protein
LVSRVFPEVGVDDRDESVGMIVLDWGRSSPPSKTAKEKRQAKRDKKAAI